MRRFALILLLLSQTTTAAAQALSADEIRALVDQKVAALDPYRDLLNDPDETRAVTAMEIMMGTGDTTLRRIALDYGLYSPSAVVRRTALDAFFATAPTLNMQMTPAPDQNSISFNNSIGSYAGSVTQEGNGFFTLTLGALDPAQGCYLDAVETVCTLRNSDAGVALRLWGLWWQLGVDDQGRLVGSGNSSSNVTMTAVIPVAF